MELLRAQHSQSGAALLAPQVPFILMEGESQRGAGAPGNRDEGIGEGGEPGAPGRGVNTALLFIYALPGCSPAGGYYVQVQYSSSLHSTEERRRSKQHSSPVQVVACLMPDDAWPAALIMMSGDRAGLLGDSAHQCGQKRGGAGACSSEERQLPCPCPPPPCRAPLT
jgi:hypothetical protein